MNFLRAGVVLLCASPIALFKFAESRSSISSAFIGGSPKGLLLSAPDQRRDFLNPVGIELVEPFEQAKELVDARLGQRAYEAVLQFLAMIGWRHRRRAP